MSARVRVWDPCVRILHGSLVAGVALAWLTSEAGRRWHEPVGWAVAAIVALRLVWGAFGSRHARFAGFLRGPRAVIDYARAVLRGRAPRYLGHNPLGAWMVVALLATLAALGLSGWLLTTDAFFGSEAMEELHEALAQGLLGLVALHVGGVIVTGRHQGENLVRAMVDGRKRAPAPGDID
ncbi:MAG TPA: cytochrome b/b6 domain-containing protein [Burkholderiaceae bacterium]|nr:cytochrome b/b6 domain-containing protein [Burkholderiaceae bacterium]